MRMAPCPVCGEHNVNGKKRKDGTWESLCFNCGYEVFNEKTISRKLARYLWNLNYEKMTGNKLPDEMCGRQKGAYMKKEKRAGLVLE